VCQRAVIINNGKIVAEDTPEQLSARLRHSEKVSLIFKAPPADAGERLSTVPGVLQVFPGSSPNMFIVECELGRDIRDDLARYAVEQRWGLLELKLVSMTLEDVFLRLTQHEDGMVKRDTFPGAAHSTESSASHIPQPESSST
jgi:ABC-2 type transport system ATP-binding protein